MKCSKTLIIGIGSTGQYVCEEVALNLNSKYGDYKNALWVGIKVLETASKSSVIDKNDFISLNIEPDRFDEYKSGKRSAGSDFDWSKWGSPTDIGEHMKNGAGNRRILGRLALYHNYDEVSTAIKSEISRLSENVTDDKIREKINLNIKEELEVDKDIEVYIIGSLCGGTGSGSCVDLGYLVREIWGKGYDIKTTVGIFTLPHWAHNDLVYKKNAYIALQELNHYMLKSSIWEQKVPGTKGYSTGRPYDITYLTSPSNNTGKAFNNIKSEIASFLITACTETGSKIKDSLSDAYRVLDNDKELGYLKPAFSTFGIASLEYPGEHISRMCKEKILQKLFGYWKDDSSADISKDIEELFEKTPKQIVDEISTQSEIKSKYEEIMRDELENLIPKNSAIHQIMENIFSDIEKEIRKDSALTKKADEWLKNFQTRLKDKFEIILDKYLVSLDGGPGYISRILKKVKEDSNPAIYSDKLESEKQNIKSLTENCLNIKEDVIGGICKEKANVWKEVIDKCVALIEKNVNLVISEKLKVFIESYTNKYITRLDNFESAIKALYSFHKDIFEYNKNKIPNINGEIIALKNNSPVEDIEDIYAQILNDTNDNPNITIDVIEKQKAQYLLDNISQELLSRFKDTDFFETKQTVDSDIKDYFPNDLKKIIDIKANKLFANLAEYRNVIYSLSQDPNGKINAIWDKAKTTIDVSKTPIPEIFENDDSIEDIYPKSQDYAFYPASAEGKLATKYSINKIEELLLNKVGNYCRIADNKDPYRITVLRTLHGFSLAHIKGILRANEDDHANLQASINFSGDGLNYWNTRKDGNWINILSSTESLNVIRRYWLVFVLVGNYKDEMGNCAVFDKDGNPDPWYTIENGDIVFDLHSGSINIDKEYIDMNFEKAITQIACDSEKEKRIQITCERKISAYIDQIGKYKFIQLLFDYLCQNGNVYTYNIGIDEKTAKKYLIEYCLEHGLVKEYTDYKFPEDREIPEEDFQYLYRERGYNDDFENYPRSGYYCANKKHPHCVAQADPYEPIQKQRALRNMIKSGFICPVCKGQMRRYWP